MVQIIPEASPLGKIISNLQSNYGKKKNQTTFERAKKYEDVDQFA